MRAWLRKWRRRRARDIVVRARRAAEEIIAQARREANAALVWGPCERPHLAPVGYWFSPCCGVLMAERHGEAKYCLKCRRVYAPMDCYVRSEPPDWPAAKAQIDEEDS